jgi:hypothetical protein
MNKIFQTPERLWEAESSDGACRRFSADHGQLKKVRRRRGCSEGRNVELSIQLKSKRPLMRINLC